MDKNIQMLYRLIVKHKKTPDEIVQDWYNMYIAAQKLEPIMQIDAPGYVQLARQYRVG